MRSGPHTKSLYQPVVSSSLWCGYKHVNYELCSQAALRGGAWINLLTVYPPGGKRLSSSSAVYPWSVASPFFVRMGYLRI